jgi:uncharacterized repeat protein (TIGR02543 family)
MNGLSNKTFFKKLILSLLVVSLISESLITTTGTNTVHASSVVASTSSTESIISDENSTENTNNPATNQNSDSILNSTSDANDLSKEDSTSIQPETETITTGDSKTDATATESDNSATNGADSTNSSGATSTTEESKTLDSSTKTDEKVLDKTAETNIAALPINEQNFPDPVFRNYIIKHFDTNEDLELSSEEISKIESLDISNMGICDLTGIEYFTNINYLYCSQNNLTSLNVSTLTQMTVLDCSYNHLTGIDLSKCTSLISVECKNNALPITLDENNCLELTTLKTFDLARASNWSENVKIDEEKLTPVESNTNNIITYDYLANAPQIPNLEVSFSLVIATDSLEDVEVNETTFPDAAFRAFVIKNFDTDEDNFLSAKERSKITYLFVPALGITDLTGISYFPNIVFLNCEDNGITLLDITALNNLRGLYASNNQLSQLVFGDTNTLNELYCSNNQLSTLDIKNPDRITKLYCDNNHLSVLDATLFPNLTELNCSKNNLSSLDLTNCNTFTFFECKDNISTVALDATNKINLSATGLDFSKVTDWSIGTMNTDNTLSLDNYTEGMSLTYNYNVVTKDGTSDSIPFTLVPKPTESTSQPTLETVTISPEVSPIAPEANMLPPATETPALVTYTVSFNTDGGSEVTAQSIQAGTTIAVPTSPTKPGFLFDSWYLGDVKYDFNTTIAADTSLTAHWTMVSASAPSIKSLKNSKKSQMKITLKSGGGVAGYEISYSTNKNASKNAIIVETNNTSYTAKDLIKDKTYYVRVRAYNFDSTGAKVYSEYSKIKKIKITKGLSEVKATGTSATIKKCVITSGSNVTLSVNTNGIIKSNDNNYYLFQLPSYKKSIARSATPLATTLKAKSFSIDTPLNLNTPDSLLYSKFVIAIKVNSGYKIVSTAKYITNPQDVADFTYPFPQASSKKGLQINASMLNDVKDLGVKNSAFNIPLDMIIAAPGENNYRSGIDYEYNGETYWFRKGMVAAYDSLFRKLERQDMVVTAIILLGWRDDLTYLITPSGREEGHNYYNFNTSDPDARKQLEATFSFLAERYASDDGNGKVVNWIIGNEINSFDAWNYAGTRSLSKYTQLYADSYRLAYNAITSKYSNAKLYVSLDQFWNTSNSVTFSGREFLEKFSTVIKESGNIKWNIAYHAYPSPLTNPKFWTNANGQSQNTPDSPIISIYNIKVLTDYVKKYYGSGTRIILSEQGFTSSQPYGEKVQAAAMAYAYYLSEFNPMIDAFILSRHVDNIAETRTGLNLGLWSNTPGQIEEAYQKKYAWNVYKYMDTPESTKATKFALKVIGKSSWKKIIPKYKASKFNSMPATDN